MRNGAGAYVQQNISVVMAMPALCVALLADGASERHCLGWMTHNAGRWTAGSAISVAAQQEVHHEIAGCC